MGKKPKRKAAATTLAKVTLATAILSLINTVIALIIVIIGLLRSS